MPRQKALMPFSVNASSEDVAVAALRVLDAQGLDRLTLSRVASAANLDAGQVARLFPDRNALLLAVATALLRQGMVPFPDGGGGWQERLRHRAMIARGAMLSCRDGALLVGQTGVPFLPEEAEAELVAALRDEGFSLNGAGSAIRLVDRFTLGWTIAEQTPGYRDAGDATSFSVQLKQVLDSIAAANKLVVPASAIEPRWLLQSRLWTLLRMARESAEIAYARRVNLNELDRRILLTLKARSPLTLAEVSASTGADKAQVSRTAKRLAEQSLVERGGMRSPLRLSPAGARLADEMMRLAELRNRELTFGVTDEQLVDLFAVMEEMIGRAVLLYEQERKLAAGEGWGEEPDLPSEPPPIGSIFVDRSRILPPLSTLCAYNMRSAALGYKRLMGLSRFEAWVLSEIACDSPLEWARLVQTLGRDESQAARTLKRLESLDLIERSGRPGRRHGTYTPTKEGWRLFGTMRHIGTQRSEFLTQNLSPAKLASFFEAFETIVRNAEAQLGRERAMEELES